MAWVPARGNTLARAIEGAGDEGSVPFTRSNLRQFGGREIAANVLMQHGRVSSQSGEKPRSINVVAQILIPPFGGSNPVSVSQNCTRMGHSRRLSQAAIFGVSFFNGSGL